jgi:hypothetical protein
MDMIGAVVAAIPCPPLPLQITRTDRETGKAGIGFANTHHILMQAYAHAIQRDCAKDNETRQMKQIELTNVFLGSFNAQSDTNPDPESLYEAGTTFTRNYLHAFMPKRSIPDARFAPYDEVASSCYENNPIVRASCEHLAGLMYYDTGGVTEYENILEPLKGLPFSIILCKYAELHRARSIVPTLVELVDDLD